MHGNLTDGAGLSQNFPHRELYFYVTTQRRSMRLLS